MSDWILAAKITSLGDDSTTATDRRYRWASGVPTGGTASWQSLYLPYMSGRLPSEVAVGIDFRAATTSIGAMSFELQYRNETGQRFYRHQTSSLGRLATSIPVGAATTIQIDDDSGSGVTGIAVGTQLALEQEVMTIAADNTGGSYDVSRGRLGTYSTAHTGFDSDPTADAEIYNADHGHLLTDREVVLIRVPRDGAETDEEVIYRGVVSGISRPGGKLLIQTKTITELLTRRKLCSNLWRLEGRASGNKATLVAERGTGPAHLGTFEGTNPAAPLSFGGNTAIVNRTDYPISIDLRGRNTDRTSRFNGSELPLPDTIDALDVWEFFSLHPTAPTLDAAGNVRLGSTTSASEANPFTLLLQILLTSPTGNNHATYDLGTTASPRIFDNLGLNIPASIVDVDAIETVRANTPARMDSLHMGFDGDPIEDALEWIQQKLLRPYSCVLTVGEDYKLTVVKLESQVLAATPTIAETDFIGIPNGDRKLDATMDSVTAEYNDRPGIGTVKRKLTDAINRQRLVSGRHAEMKVDASGIEDAELVLDAAIELVQRFHDPLPIESFVLPNTKSYWPGQLLSVTHSKIPGADGTLGITNAAFQVVRRRGQLFEASIAYDCVFVSAIFGNTALIAPALIVDTPLGGGVYTVEENAVISTYGADDVYKSDTAPFVDGDVVQAHTRARAVSRSGTRTITINSTTQITLSSEWTPSAQPAGSVIAIADYDDATAGQRALWTWMANTSYQLGSGNVTGYQYT